MAEPPKFDTYQFKDWTDTQLVGQVSRSAGTDGAAAQAELIRRLMVAFRHAETQAKSLTRLTVALLILTGGLFVTGVVQLLVHS